MAEVQKKTPKVASPLSSKLPAQKFADEGTPNVPSVEDINKALGRVNIVHGAQELPFDVAGKSIAYVREALGPILAVPADAATWVDNKQVTDETTLLTANSTLEFIRPSGVKG